MARELLKFGANTGSKMFEPLTGATELGERVKVGQQLLVNGSITKSTASGSYSTGQMFAPSTVTATGGHISWLNCAGATGAGGLIVGGHMLVNCNMATNPLIDLYVFNATVTQTSDFAASWAPTSAERQSIIGLLRFDSPVVLASASGSSGSLLYAASFVGGQSVLPFTASDANLYGLARVQNGWTPTTNAELVFRLAITRD